MKAKAGYRHQKMQYGTGKWLKRYMSKRTCRSRGSRNRSVAASVLAILLLATIGCASAPDRQRVASVLHGADQTVLYFRSNLKPDDPLVTAIDEVRDEAKAVIDTADLWAAGGEKDPTESIWDLLEFAEKAIMPTLDDDGKMTASRIIAGVRVHLLLAGLVPPASDIGSDQPAGGGE